MVRFIKKMNDIMSAFQGTSRVSFVKEQAIKTVFFFTAFFAVIVVMFILLFLLRDGFVIFEKAGVSQSFPANPGLRQHLYLSMGSSRLSPEPSLSQSERWSLLSRFPSAVQSIFLNSLPPGKTRTQTGCRTACRHPLCRVWVLRAYRSHQFYPGDIRSPYG